MPGKRKGIPTDTNTPNKRRKINSVDIEALPEFDPGDPYAILDVLKSIDTPLIKQVPISVLFEISECAIGDIITCMQCKGETLRFREENLEWDACHFLCPSCNREDYCFDCINDECDTCGDQFDEPEMICPRCELSEDIAECSQCFERICSHCPNDECCIPGCHCNFHTMINCYPIGDSGTNHIGIWEYECAAPLCDEPCNFICKEGVSEQAIFALLKSIDSSLVKQAPICVLESISSFACKPGHSDVEIFQQRFKIGALRCFGSNCNHHFCTQHQNASSICLWCTQRDAMGRVVGIRCLDCCREHECSVCNLNIEHCHVNQTCPQWDQHDIHD